MSEKKFKKKLAQAFKERYGHTVHIDMVESPDTSPGIPDMNIAMFGGEFWVETKFSKEGDVPKMRPPQIAWFKNRRRAGAHHNTCVLWARDDELFFIPGVNVPYLRGKKDWEKYSRKLGGMDPKEILYWLERERVSFMGDQK